MSNSKYEEEYFRFLEAFVSDKEMASYIIRGGAAVKILFQSERLSQDFDFVYQSPIRQKPFEVIVKATQRISDRLGLHLAIDKSEKKILISPPKGIPFFEIVNESALTSEIVLWKGKTVLVETPEELLADKIALLALRPDGPYGNDIVDIATILSSVKIKSVWKQLLKEKYDITEIKSILKKIFADTDTLCKYCCPQIINFVPGLNEKSAAELVKNTIRKIKGLID